MFASQTTDYAKNLPCPKCGRRLHVSQRTRTKVSECATGCGVWIDQVEIDANSSTAAGESGTGGRLAGFWRSRRLARS